MNSSARLVAVVVAAVVVGAIWFSMRAPGGGTGTDVVAPVVSPVEDYLAFIDGLAVTGSSTEDLAVDGLRKLAGALGILDVGGAELPIDLRIVAEHLVINAQSVETAAAVRRCLIAAAVALDGQVSDASALQRAADAVDPQLPITQQREALVRFFTLAADGIRRSSAAAQ